MTSQRWGLYICIEGWLLNAGVSPKPWSNLDDLGYHPSLGHLRMMRGKPGRRDGEGREKLDVLGNSW